MPWKTSDGNEARWQFVTQKLAQKYGSMKALCQRHGISRECGYKWWRRFKTAGQTGLVNLRAGSRAGERLRQRWWDRLKLVRVQEREFGPKKLHWKLRRDYPRERVPSVRTLARWLERAGKVRRPKRRARLGPAIKLAGRLAGRCANDVWPIDLKGSFCTKDGQRINPLTVRDLASRYELCVQDVGKGGEREIGPVMLALFRRYGLPRALRMDNGSPFGAGGPRGWSHLSATWIKLGIRLEYGRPRCPQDNAEQEQMHRMLKDYTARPASLTAAAQHRRFARWRHWYNHRRPHEAIGMRVPASCYRPSSRRLPRHVRPWRYPRTWVRLLPDAKGRCQWRKSQRLIGQAFVHEQLGGKPLGPDVLAVYFGPHLIGTLHAKDRAGLRPVQWRLPPLTKQEGLRPSRNPPRSS